MHAILFGKWLRGVARCKSMQVSAATYVYLKVILKGLRLLYGERLFAAHELQHTKYAARRACKTCKYWESYFVRRE
jgi:hypothetical protein